MASFPSDSAIIEAFDRKEKKFWRWEEENKPKMVRMHPVDALLYLDQHWPDPDEQNQYIQWAQKWYGRHTARAARTFQPREFRAKTMETNFASAKSRSVWLSMMAWGDIPLWVMGEGKISGSAIGCALSTGSHFLWPNCDKGLGGGAMDRYLLGINHNVAIRYTGEETSGPPSTNLRKKSRVQEQATSGEDQVRQAAWGDIQAADGFIFAQLGVLCVSKGGPGAWQMAKAKGLSQIPSEHWERTRYGVVVELKEGRPGPVWVIYNFYDVGEEDDEPYHIPVFNKEADKSPLRSIGRLYDSCPRSFTVAKIANSLGELNERAIFGFECRPEIESQLVRVVALGEDKEGRQEGPLVRQFVKKSQKQNNPKPLLN